MVNAISTKKILGCNFFAYSWKLPAYSGAFDLQLTILAFYLQFYLLLLTILAFLLLTNIIIRALRDCKQRSLPVSKKAPTVSKKASPKSFRAVCKGRFANGHVCNLGGVPKEQRRRRTEKRLSKSREWSRYCRKVCWTKTVQNGPDDHFGQSEPDLAFAKPKWTTMVHFAPFWPEEAILVHLGPPTVLWPFLEKGVFGESVSSLPP